MKKILLMSVLGLFLFSCSNSEKNMTVTGNVKGLKKGTLYLQQLKDTILVTLDSLEVKGNGTFSFETELESPDMFYLYLTKKDYNDINDRIRFFGEPGAITINTSWDNFETDAKINGSKSNDIYQEYLKGMSRFNTKSLSILQARFDPKFQNDSIALDSLVKLSDKNLYRSYAYALNFALNNKESFVAPYIAVNEVPDANVKYLDSINSVLPSDVANSKYGKDLKKHLEEIKAEKE
ncbi:DUF4369 domain-containing protein [Cellulophaga baltica]|jgi:hypothetical protein|uniref:DUF4369 domain-containing protein n=1 Tax=Cellulophaga TaxID=104264 RepID=UPI001C073B07|nr:MULTISPECIES: DUF4369 domain-containing protein [Cellulophaga]MBU2998075.1 DUF4369 domain-containing protein [Cellulophaga baltica]MDO6769477.1 DUF4369 domain-containing protein [Cellulophaga sp. 1_MG-2023]